MTVDTASERLGSYSLAKMRVGLTLIVALAAGCFNPKLDDEPFLCGPDPDPCPPGFTCDTDREVCVQQVGDEGPPGP